MELSLLVIFFIVVAVVATNLYKTKLLNNREKFINTYRFPEKISQQLISTYPHLTTNQQKEVIKGLHDYFQVCLILGKKPIAMPSKIVDLAWHEFILFTKAYQSFCKQAFGRFLHHTPAEAMASQTMAQEGVRNTWKIACKQKNINPRNPKKLPLLFAIDKKLAIKDGFHYKLNCKKAQGGDYCANHIGCGSGCGVDDSYSSCSSGCSSGCGGD